jgi:hypothetical protein
VTRRLPRPPRIRLAVGGLAAALLFGCGAETQDVAEAKHLDTTAPEAEPKPAPAGAAPCNEPTEPHPTDAGPADECLAGLPDGGNSEIWGDAIDSDCDGKDTPSCVGVAEGRAVTALVPSEERCEESSDVRIVDVVDCWHCCSGGKMIGFIGNAGGVPFRGRVVVRYALQEAGKVTEGELLTVEELGPSSSSFFELDGDNGDLELQLWLYNEQGAEISNCSGEGRTKSFRHGRCPCAR